MLSASKEIWSKVIGRGGKLHCDVWSNLGVKLNISATLEEFIQGYDVLSPSEKLGMDKPFNLANLSNYKEGGGCKVALPPHNTQPQSTP